MYNSFKILALVPAIGGSKGLPRKNIKPLCGKPLIAWTIETAKASRYLDKIVVSTDDKEIAGIAISYGAEVPFSRPTELATDNAKIIDVVLHIINWLENNGELYDLIVLLQPTSPLRLSTDIDSAIKMIFQKSAKSIVSVCEVEHHPYLSNQLPENGCMKDFLRCEVINTNRQELPTFFRLNGAIYIAYCNYLKKQKTFFGKDTYAYIMPRERSIDIDSETDFNLAELLINKMRKQYNNSL